MPIIWDDYYLSQLLQEAEERIGAEVDLHFGKYALPVTQGTSTYSIPSYIKKILYVTWKGKTVTPLDQTSAMYIGYATSVIDSSNREEYQQGEPTYYFQHPTNLSVIRLIPTPNETITPTGSEDLYLSTNSRQFLVFNFFRETDTTSSEFSLPAHLGRSFTRYYALYRAFSKEGKGQNLKLATYYRKLYLAQLEALKLINANTYISKRHGLGSLPQSQNRALARPVLPSRFPR
jgi:hypothetical protein